MGAAASNIGIVDALLIMVMVGGIFGIIDAILKDIARSSNHED